MVVSAPGSRFGFVVVAEIWSGPLPMFVFVMGLGAERPIGQASPSWEDSFPGGCTTAALRLQFPCRACQRLLPGRSGPMGAVG
jgi:hypothetical protein